MNHTEKKEFRTGFTRLERINIGKETGDKNFGLKNPVNPVKKKEVSL